MTLTFAQYSILKATYKGVTYGQLEQETNFDYLMITYYISGLLTIGLIQASNKEGSETTFYKLTDEGENSIEEYERANPALIIKQASNQS
ncbi:MarR family transcriptional regulator [Spirosoma sp. KCTC 42546]|uniref:MarR family transcriptional regulator n=1 Tax=Spirosoma sp. KCTC 42546 TaxID=2520506 RepID=UPI00115BA7EE|nr:MarR family transcriptional regulator [Spirosoma sp. KCTC 42546]QDK81654.1 MarR family transcriptional regulator [Spirosoma sp. KCTC 42546]